MGGNDEGEQRTRALQVKEGLTCSRGNSGSAAGSESRPKNVRMASATRGSASAGSAAMGAPSATGRAACHSRTRSDSSATPQRASVRATSVMTNAATCSSSCSLRSRVEGVGGQG